MLVAVLGGVGLGLYPSGVSRNAAVLMLIPFVCVYVDVCVRHLNLRVFIIAKFLRSTRSEATEKYFAEYEDFCYTKRQAFKLEDVVFQWSSIFLSAFVAGVPILFKETNVNLPFLFFYVAGGGGIIGAILVERFYRSYVSFIETNPGATDGQTDSSTQTKSILLESTSIAVDRLVRECRRILSFALQRRQ